jgi:hypothetical protein
MATTIQHKRDTAANWTSNGPTLAAGEFGFETDTGKFKVGDGSTAWASLNYFEPTATPPPPTNVIGEACGYAAGGWLGPTAHNTINKYSFTTDGNATDVGDLTICDAPYGQGASSPTHGYQFGGRCLGVNIDKIAFASDGNATDAGVDTPAHTSPINFLNAIGNDGSAAYRLLHGFTSPLPPPSGGPAHPTRTAGTGPNQYQQPVDKFTFSSESWAATTLVHMYKSPYSVCHNVAVSSPDHMYVTSYGYCKPDYWKIPFAGSDTFSSCVGDIVTPHLTPTAGPTGVHAGAYQSTTYGYIASNRNELSGNNNLILKFPFSSDANTTLVGCLTCDSTYNIRRGSSGTTSAPGHGYSHGGFGFNPSYQVGVINIIDKFPFASDANATDVGDLTIGYGNSSSSNIQQ